MGIETEMTGREEQFYLSTKRWISDLKFFEIETDFLRHLQQDYLIRLFEPEDIQLLKEVGNKVSTLKLDMKSAHSQCIIQLNRLTGISKHEFMDDIIYLTFLNDSLSDLNSALTQDYYDVKKELFKLAETVMRESKLMLA